MTLYFKQMCNPLCCQYRRHVVVCVYCRYDLGGLEWPLLSVQGASAGQRLASAENCPVLQTLLQPSSIFIEEGGLDLVLVNSRLPVEVS